MDARQKIAMGYIGVGLAAALIAGVATWAIVSNTSASEIDTQTAEERVSELEAEIARLTAANERAAAASDSLEVDSEEPVAANEDDSTAENERQFCFVTGIVNETGETMVTVDYAELLTGAEANAAATAAGEESPPPNDFFIRNVNPKLRTFPVKPGIQVHLTASSGQGIDGLDIGLGEWHDSFAGMSPGYEVQHVPYWITITNGVIVEIEEQYLP